MILVELGVNNRLGDAAQQTILQMHNSPNRECFLASIALDSLDRSRLVSSGEAAFSLY